MHQIFSRFIFTLIVLNIFSTNSNAQEFTSEIDLLQVDTQYAYFQYYSSETGERFRQLFDGSKEERVVLFHFGASHIQAEVVVTEARKRLHKVFGDAGPGYLFPFSAAKTYSGINYKTSHYGNWNFAKSYQIPPKLPLGPRGMTIETRDPSAGFSLQFQQTIPKDAYQLIVFFDNHDSTPAFQIRIGTDTINVSDSLLKTLNGAQYLILNLNRELDDLHLDLMADSSSGDVFRFYGFSLEKKEQKGLLYQPLGVGASPFEAVLHMEKIKDQAAILKPDIVMLDYGTNNILYKNEVPEQLTQSVAEAVKLFREINPEIIIVLTSPQDLYYKGRYIDAAVAFTKLMDSLARMHNCMYWNFYDLSGGFARIRDWRDKGYAQKDHIHLTKDGYSLKGYLLSQSIVNTLEYARANPDSAFCAIPVKNYDTLIIQHKHPVQSGISTHKVQRGDTLSELSRKYGTSVSELKRINGLRSDMIRVGQVLRVR